MPLLRIENRRPQGWGLLVLTCLAYACVASIQRTQPHLIDLRRWLHDVGHTYVNARIIAAILYLFATYSGVFAVLAAGLRVAGLPVRDALALRLPSKRAVVGAALLVLLMGGLADAAQSALSTFVPGLEPIPRHTQTSYEDVQYRLAYIGMCSTFTVVAEEFMHRGLLFAIVEKRSSRWAAVLVTSATFSVLHLAPEWFVFYFVFGLFCGSLRAATGSIWPGVALHGVHNLVVTLWWLLPEVFQ